MPVRLLLPRQLYEEMVAQAVAELPNECCGLLAGRMEDPPQAEPPAQDVWRVARRYPLINKTASPIEYFADEKSLIHAHLEMRRLGLDLLAVYHSHPISQPVPSRKDLEMNYQGDVVHFIISLQTGQPNMRGWW